MPWARHSTREGPSWACFPGTAPHKVPIDSNGNLASKTEGTDTWAYTWNAENELTKVEKNGAEIARFSYDPLGRRVEKVAAGVTTGFTYDGEDILREARGATPLRHIHGPGIDEPLATEAGSTLNYYHADWLGSVAKATGEAGAVVREYRYDVWGAIEAGASEAGYAFTGREWDPETGLYYYRARYYDPKGGRWTSQDPIGFLGGINLYGYVLNRPASATDPRGLYETGGPNRNPDDNTIVCLNGKVAVSVFFSFEQYNCGITSCTIRHEEYHKCQVERKKPNICEGAPDNTLVIYSSSAEKSRDESAATGIEVRCLQGWMRGASSDCRRRIDCRLQKLACYKRNGWNAAPCSAICLE